MKILIMVDSFKGSLSSYQAGMCIKETVERMDPTNCAKVLPIADGGEGTIDALMDLPGVEKEEVFVHNPLMEEVKAKYAISKKNHLAIMEMSQAAGITLLQGRLSPMKAHTYGVGEMIIDALDKGVTNFIIGIGGSATNDGGVGMLQALGYKFLDAEGNEISGGVQGLEKLASIDIKGADPRLKQCRFDIACDVDNPLTGINGAAYVFGPQKGADPKEVRMIDAYHKKYHQVTKLVLNDADDLFPGVGAAGGLGYAFKNYLGANLESGIALILDLLHAEEHIKACDLVITGEGKMDFQTSMGKTPVGIAKLAKKHGKKVIAFAGIVDNDAQEVNKVGIDAFFPILDKITTLEEAMDCDKAKENLSRCVTQVFHVMNLWRE